MNRHCKSGFISGFVVLLLFIILLSGVGTGRAEQIINTTLVKPPLFILTSLGVDIPVYGTFTTIELFLIIASFLIYFFTIGFTLGSVSSLIITRLTKNKANPQQEATS